VTHPPRPRGATNLRNAILIVAIGAAGCGGETTFDEAELLRSVESVGSEKTTCPDHLGASAEGETQHCFRTALNPDEFVKRLVNAVPAPDGFDLETGFDWVRDSDVPLQGGCIADVIDSSVPYPYAGGEALFGVGSAHSTASSARSPENACSDSAWTCPSCQRIK
jgi:hypothetical protein